MTKEPLSISGFQRALKSVSRKLRRGGNIRLTLCCYANLYIVALNIRSAVQIIRYRPVPSEPAFNFRIRLRYQKRGWKLSARQAGRTVTFESSRDV